MTLETDSAESDNRLGIGLYGTNGHQLETDLSSRCPEARVVAIAAGGNASIPGVRSYQTLDELLADSEVQAVSLCSPRRSDQARDAMRCLAAGKHVYAEKPCALNEADLDELLIMAAKTGLHFREMAATVVEQPYKAMREVIASGEIGQVVQILAQKSYPWMDHRPSDEDIDGGLMLQVGIYLARFVEHIAGCRIESVDARETMTGNPDPESGCHMAAAFLMTFEGGGVATGICNYLNHMPQRCWGYEILRVFGSQGIIESCLETSRCRIIRHGKDPENLVIDTPSDEHFSLFVDAIRNGNSMLLSLEEEIRPTRWAIRARESANLTKPN